MTEKRFTLEKDYDCEGNWEYCYQDNETGRRFNFADENCEGDFLNLVNYVTNNLKNENEQLKKRIKELEIENQGQSDAIDGLQGFIAHFDLEDILND